MLLSGEALADVKAMVLSENRRTQQISTAKIMVACAYMIWYFLEVENYMHVSVFVYMYSGFLQFGYKLTPMPQPRGCLLFF